MFENIIQTYFNKYFWKVFRILEKIGGKNRLKQTTASFETMTNDFSAYTSITEPGVTFTSNIFTEQVLK